MQRILLYSGEGTSAFCKKALLHALGDHTVLQVDRNFLQNDHWHQEWDWIVIPGGRDLPYCHDLENKANQSIQRFVRKGGKYLGICAGGYYGSSFVQFYKGHPLEVCGDRELAFFSGSAVGPAFIDPPFAYHSEDGARNVKLSSNVGEVQVYFNGGCYFENAKSYENTSILAYYQKPLEDHAAVIRCEYGSGFAILSGVHPEISLSRLQPKITPNEDKKRELFFQHLLRLL